tara:strand:- start:307 stop:1272 length:966 start_codon:yes stop_codon:yes gene_type:complete
MEQQEEWNEVKAENPEKEKVEFEVEKDEPKKEEIKQEVKQEVKTTEPEVKKEEPKELEGINTKGAEKRIRQLIKQRKDRENEIARLIKQNEELNNKIQKTNTDFSKLSKLNLDATEKQLNDKLELARSAYKTAHEEGDSVKILKAQEYLNETQNDLKSLGATKEHFKEQPEVTQQVRQPQQQYQQPTPDPKAQDWASKNEWFGQDKVMTAAALAIDADLKQEGFSPTEDEYYQEIDNRLKESFPHKYQKEENRKQESTPAQVVAGGTRSTPSSKNKVKLSKDDVRLANKWNIPLEQYAQEKLKATNAEGEYTTVNMQRGGK